MSKVHERKKQAIMVVQDYTSRTNTRGADDIYSGAAGWLFRLPAETVQGNKPKAISESYPYRTRDDFLSPAELSFYHVLSQLVGTKATILTKVRLADLFFVARPHENSAAFNHIAQRHVDFVLCEPATMKPVLAVELDDASHQRAGRKARDEFVDKVFQAASLPLLRTRAQHMYSSQEIAIRIMPFLNGTPETTTTSNASVTSPAAATTPGTPSDLLCPKCGEPMVVRTATRGERQGQQFYDCKNFPKCREIQWLVRGQAIV